MRESLVVLGAGFGGLSFLYHILHHLPDHVAITVIDRHPFHACKPEFYALASGSLEEKQVVSAIPHHPQITHLIDEAIEISPTENKVYCQHSGGVPFDRLVVALGSVDNYFNVPWAEDFVMSLQSFDKAMAAREKIKQLEAGQRVVIVGGGLTAIEFAADLREQRPDLELIILERGETILAPLGKKIQSYVGQYLEEHHVHIMTNIEVTTIEEKQLHYKNKRHPVPFDLCVWAAGIRAHPLIHPLYQFNGHDKLGRIYVERDFSIKGKNNIYVIGDCAHSDFAPSAQLAEAQGILLAEVFHCLWTNKEFVPRPIKLKGVLGNLGKRKGFGVINDKTLTGAIPHVIKSGVLWLHKHHLG